LQMREVDRTFENGILTRIGFEADKMVVKHDADVGAALDYAQALRNADEYTSAGIKGNFWHTVHIPDIIVLKMKMEDGFDAYKASAKELRQFLSRNKDKYGNLFVTKGKF
jgi:hypothetical protein